MLNGHTGGPSNGRQNLVIAPDYIAHGMRLRASVIAAKCLGPRTEAEIPQSLLREVDQQQLTSLDRTLIRQPGADRIDLTGNPQDRQRQNALLARLQQLEGIGQAARTNADRWKLQPGMAATLEASPGRRQEALRRNFEMIDVNFAVTKLRPVGAAHFISGPALSLKLRMRLQ